MSDKNNIVLTKLFLKLDIRDTEDSGKKKIMGMMIMYLFINTLISLSNFERFDLSVFVFSSLTINLFLISFVVISDYADLFFSPKHIRILKSLPVIEENIFISKIISAFIYLSVYPLVVTLPPAVYIYFYNHNIADSLYYVLISFMFSYFIIGFVFLLNSAIIIKTKAKNRVMIFIFQILFIAFIFSLNKYSSVKTASSDFFNLEYIKFLPQYYLVMGFHNFIYLIAFSGVILLLFAFLYLFLRQNYFKLFEVVNSSYTPKNKYRRKIFSFDLHWLEEIFLKDNIEKASFGLVKNHLINTSILKYRLIPLLILPVIATAVTFLGNPNEMLILSGFRDIGQSGLIVLSPVINLTILISSRMVFSNLIVGFEEDDDITSLYAALPIESRFSFYKGIIKYINLYLITPLIIICCAMVFVRIQSIEIVLNFVFLFLFMNLFNIILIRFEKRLPFSIPASKFNNSTKYFQLLIAVLIGIVLITAQIFIFKSFILFIIAIFVILLLIVLLNKVFK